MGILNIFNKKPKKSKENLEEKPIEDKALVILIDNPKAGMVDYFNSLGIKVKALYSDLDELKMDVMFDDSKARIVIADSGIGKFRDDKNSNSLYDLLEIVKNNKNSLSVISSSDNLIRSIAKIVKRIEKLDKNEDDKLDIDYAYYDNIKSILDLLLSYRERYVVEGAKDIIYHEPLKFKGILSDFDKSSNVSFDDFSLIRGLNDDSDDCADYVKAFQVKI